MKILTTGSVPQGTGPVVFLNTLSQLFDKNKLGGICMEERNNTCKEISEEKEQTEISETWAEDALADLEDFIEEQGIYIRQ